LNFNDDIAIFYRVKIKKEFLMDQVFSGIQPTGTIHLGNYIGAIKNWAQIQHNYPSLFCLVDYHAMTIRYNPQEMPALILKAAIVNLACGLDPKVCSLFIQSDVSAHTELLWILTTVTPYGDLTRMTQFKDKSLQNSDNINAGLFCYPILMVADILVYKATHVPVGEDQLQHLELTREIARRFNHTFNTDFFPEPKAILTETPKILGLDGKYKMSKSLNNYISLEETPKSLWDKIRGAKTDEQRVKRTDKGNPDVCNIFTLHKIFSKTQEINCINQECRKAEIGCVDCKKILNHNLLEFLDPIQEKISYYENNLDEVRDILKTGAQKAQALANQILDQVKALVGLKVF